MIRKGVFIPDITVEMFRNATLESVEDMMASGYMEEIEIPERPRGEWIKKSLQIDEHHFRSYAKCKVCGCSFKPYSFAVKEFDFCPECGADMRGVKR